MLIRTENITKSFGDRNVLQNISLQINSNEKIGLIGANGAGKSTLLKILIGELLPDSGIVQTAKNLEIGYLEQNTGFFSEKTIWDELLPVFTPLLQIESEMRELEKRMGEAELLSNAKLYQKTLDRYSFLQAKFEEEGGYQYEAQMRGALTGLGLGGIDWKNTRISDLSGGQKTRLLLAKLLLTEPDLLILDEPTNYLDIEAITWLEQTLIQYSGSILLVSHDRYFLDRLVTIIYELEQNRITRYVGNYSKYVKLKHEKILQQQKLYEEQEKKIKKMEEFVERNIARSSTSKRAKSRRKQLEKLDRIDPPNLPKAPAAIRFETSVVSGRQVLQVENMTIGYEKPLISNLTFQIERGEHIAILGKNGLGKSTLLKTIVGEIQPLSVEQMKFGSNVEIDYYEQEHRDLDLSKQVIDELWDAHPTLDQTAIRNYLGQFLFHGDKVFTKVEKLSGGEKARLSLAKRLLNKANFLLMDEPTNHLDLASKEKLEEALENFPGTILFISHDRYFIQRIATRIWELTPDGIVDYRGDYEWYLRKKALMEEETRMLEEKASQGNSIPVSNAEEWRQREKKIKRKKKQYQQRLKQVEQAVETLEEQIKEIEDQLCLPEIYEDPQRSMDLNSQLTSLLEQREEKMEEWMQLIDQESDLST